MNIASSPDRQHGRILGGLVGLVAIAGIATLVVGIVERETRDQIAANQAALALRTINAALPAGEYDNQPHLDSHFFTNALLGNASPMPAYRARYGDRPVAVALTLDAPDGYVAPIRLLVGIAIDGRVIAVNVLEHRETPGLGDRIEAEKSDWIRLFDGKQVADTDRALRLRRDGGDLDHITGATITSRAVANAVANALRFYAINKDELVAPPDNGGL